ncbi:hypothetical protein H0H87_010788 [Tephrocybe sp. NHM501043]|nr:hypothetical protein H0H87_010788 [Tephrocybe sp. NHM501043]
MHTIIERLVIFHALVPAFRVLINKPKIYKHHTAAGHTMEKAKAELATHGAKAYFTRG